MSHLLEEHKKRQDRITDLINSVVDYLELDPSKIAEFSKELCDIYSLEGFRHSYSEISIAVEMLAADQRDVLCENLRLLQEGIETELGNQTKSVEEQNQIRQKIAKLYDHIDLESIRLARIDRVEFIGREASTALTAADGKLKETEDKANELSERVSDYHAQSISILGIFSGLVITFSSVIQFSTTSLTNITNTDAYKVTYFLCLAFYLLFNILFMLMYCISKLSGKSIATDCRRKNCSNCRQCKTIFGRLKTKYPYVFWFNLVGLALIILIFVTAIK